jgi:hypothetical protein
MMTSVNAQIPSLLYPITGYMIITQGQHLARLPRPPAIAAQALKLVRSSAHLTKTWD